MASFLFLHVKILKYPRSFVPAESATLGVVDKSMSLLIIPLSRSPNWLSQFLLAYQLESPSQGYCLPINTWIRRVANIACQIQSAFMIDLNQVSLALRNSTSRSLILLDEFGKGTLATGSYFALEFFLDSLSDL